MTETGYFLTGFAICTFVVLAILTISTGGSLS